MLTTIAALSKLVLDLRCLVKHDSLKSEHDSVGGLGCFFNVFSFNAVAVAPALDLSFHTSPSIQELYRN